MLPEPPHLSACPFLVLSLLVFFCEGGNIDPGSVHDYMCSPPLARLFLRLLPICIHAFGPQASAGNPGGGGDRRKEEQMIQWATVGEIFLLAGVGNACCLLYGIERAREARGSVVFHTEQAESGRPRRRAVHILPLSQGGVCVCAWANA